MLKRKPSTKKRKAAKFSEDPFMAPKVMSHGGETKKYKLKPSDEERSRHSMKSSGDTKDVSARPKTKGGQVNPLREDSKALKITNSSGGSKRLKLSVSEEAPTTLKFKLKDEGTRKGKSSDGMGRLEPSTRLQLKPFEGVPRRSKPKTAEGVAKVPFLTPSGDGRGVTQTKSHEETKGLKLKLSERGTRRLTFKPLGYGAGEPEIRGQEDMRKIQLMDNEQEIANRPKAKRQKVKAVEEGAQRVLDGKQPHEGPKKLQTKMYEGATKMPDISTPKEERNPPSRSKAKRTKARTSEEEIPRRPIVNAPEEGPKKIKVGPLQDRSKKRKLDSSEDTVMLTSSKTSRGKVKVAKVNASEEPPQRPRTQPVGDKRPHPRSSGKRTKASAVPQRKRGQKAKRVEKWEDEFDLSTSDFEGEWFRKYVQVTIGPLSNHKLSKAIQSVEVTSSMFEDVRRRSEAGEEVHIDTLHATEGQPKKTKALEKPAGLSGNELDLVAKFWQTAVLSEIPEAQAFFMEQKEQHRKVALSFALHCKTLLEIEVAELGLVQDDTSPFWDAISPEDGDVPPSEVGEWPPRPDASRTVGEEIAAERSADMRGSSSNGDDDSADLDEASQSGDELLVSGGELVAGGGTLLAISGEQLVSDHSASEGSANGGNHWGNRIRQSGEPLASGDEPSVGVDEPSMSADEPSASGSEPSGGEGVPSPSRVDESSTGGEGSPSGGGDDPLPGDGDRSPSGGEDEPWPSGEDALPNGDEGFHDGGGALLAGDESFLSADEGSQSGGGGSPREDDLD